MKLTQILSARGQFQYFKRYIERELQKGYVNKKWYPLAGYKESKKTNWYYGEHLPGTDAFMQENKTKKKPILIERVKEWNFFKGDRVEILVGKDKGKQGVINGMIKERNWVYVEGLNCEYETNRQFDDLPPVCMKSEKPLLVTSQVKLVDPSDAQTTEVEWRFTEEGERVRVSVRTGRIVPLPPGFYEMDDHVIPKYYEENAEKDTKEKVVTKVTFKPKLCSFEQDIMDSVGIKEERKPAPTYWY